jgi:hypothetical protein
MRSAQRQNGSNVYFPIFNWNDDKPNVDTVNFWELETLFSWLQYAKI